ncbi:ferritin-like domain-containing protein [Christiangramia fulva]|uniref:Ferritin-like domain-containing protein n=1 Tax=Christiangramia fulva TaxID=2126553 RepID=A0A2R3Z9T9_9FLAO|nr:ferritin-like domain-containing protein [Christiangramia fulva]AVR47030.1 ferritin-like domain-containing protein [Christiangramia fulva]
MKNLKDLFETQLKDLYSVESQLVEALPKMVKKSHHPGLQKAFEEHLQETQKHKEKLEKICSELGIKPEGKESLAMKAMIAEAEQFVEKAANDNVRDAGIIAHAQHVEHYEISGYGALIEYAKDLGHDAIADRLLRTLDQERSADDELKQLAKSRINQEAQ